MYIPLNWANNKWIWRSIAIIIIENITMWFFSQRIKTFYQVYSELPVAALCVFIILVHCICMHLVKKYSKVNTYTGVVLKNFIPFRKAYFIFLLWVESLCNLMRNGRYSLYVWNFCQLMRRRSNLRIAKKIKECSTWKNVRDKNTSISVSLTLSSLRSTLIFSFVFYLRNRNYFVIVLHSLAFLLMHLWYDLRLCEELFKLLYAISRIWW